MKFLCVNCDEQMKLVQTIPPDQGSGVSIIYGCPSCSNQVGMLTNAMETQVVSSLGVEIGGRTVNEIEGQSGDGLDKCPFGDLVRQMGSEDQSSPDSPTWTNEAFERLQNIPEFVRPMAKQGIEGYAKSNGYGRIDERVLDEARDVFGM